MAGLFSTTRRVEFSDTDAAGMMHFAAFFDVMEQAEHELLRHLGLGVFLRHPEGTLSWPRVSAQCDFRAPARFEDILDTAVKIERVGEKSVSYRFQIRRADADVAEGMLVTVCCLVAPGQPPRPISIPEDIARMLRGYAQRSS